MYGRGVTGCEERLPLAMDRIITGLPAWLLREYLVELGGTAEDERVLGDCWLARVTAAEPRTVGALSVGQVRFELVASPRALAHILPALEKKLLRAGG